MPQSAIPTEGRIQAHFDVGNIGLSDAEANAHFIVKASLAAGGESIPEERCVSSTTVVCAFPDYPGTVGTAGFYHFKNELSTAIEKTYSTMRDCPCAWCAGFSVAMP